MYPQLLTLSALEITSYLTLISLVPQLALLLLIAGLPMLAI